MKRVAVEDLSFRPFHLLDREWALLVAGSGRPNPMTVSWGGFGTLWNRPVAKACPGCDRTYLQEKVTKRDGRRLVCDAEGCGHVEAAEG